MKERKRKMMVLSHKVWKKVKEHYEAKEFPLREVRMSMEGWTMKWEVVCHKLPTGTKNSKVRGMGRMRVILGQTRRGLLKIEKKR